MPENANKDFKLFKQEIKSEFDLFKQEIKELINKKIIQFVPIASGVVALFVIAYAFYFEHTHNSINEINTDRAAFQIEKKILKALNKHSDSYHYTEDVKKQNPDIDERKRKTSAGRTRKP